MGVQRCFGIFTILLLLSFSFAFAESLREWDKKAVEKYKKAKADYLKVKNFYEKARKEWKDLKRKARSAKGNNTVNLDKARNFLLRADEFLIANLKKIRAYVESEPSIDNQTREEILSAISSDIEWLVKKQDEIKNAKTKKELSLIARAIRKKWNEVRPKVKRFVGKVARFKAGKIIKKAEKLAERVEKAIAKLKEKGVDTKELEEWLAKFRKDIEIAKEKAKKAKEKHEAIKGMKDADKLFREGHLFLKGANKVIRADYLRLKEIVRKMRNGK
ncbi:hypothetical protein D6829_01755 [Candidatus Pacearchaeota archaeon]|nr:MAG: hypothetical protein D6829_01755 [Candidatus Pacearchaeota archaeon]